VHCFDRWLPLRALENRFPDVPARTLQRAVARLVDAGLLQRSTAPKSISDEAVAAWETWHPEAAFFHFATKDVQYTDGSDHHDGVGCVPAPPALKAYRSRPRVRLDAAKGNGDLPRVLLERRTWRRFARRAISRQDLSTLMGLTWGVQDWIHVPGHKRMAMKTSPSGGARHSIEAYVLALRVNGLARGLYYFAPDEHSLVLIERGGTARHVERYLPGQPGFRGAAALVIMTSVFARKRARYPFARAYRGILVEAGHLCQTFCLVATWLGLAPFCSMAFADSVIERDLRVDGISEAAIYVTGVGARPAATDWAPWPDRSWPMPRRSPPRWRRR
jgi:SagB-type dehydrogenase family enzyme